MDEYVVDVNGIPHTVQATAEDAKARGLELKSKPVELKSKPVANKARRRTVNKAVVSDES